MDRQARKLAVHREEGSEGGSELGSNTDSDSDEKVASRRPLLCILLEPRSQTPLVITPQKKKK